MGFQIKGISQMRARLRNIAKQYPQRVEKAMRTEAEIEVTEMKRRTPVDTRLNAPHPGQLRNSIHVFETGIRGDTIYAIIATGAEVDEYAIYVHEDPDAFHPIGQWKFMESVIVESQPHMANRIAKRAPL